MGRPGDQRRRRVETRLTAVACALALMLVAATAASAATTPSPSPSLDTVLASPTSGGYVRDSTIFMPIQGNFDAVDYLGVLAPRKPSETFATLKADGFVQGYGRAWFDRSANRFLVEMVVAFSGGAGAGRWLPEARALSQDNPSFKRDVAVTGIDTAFGGHFENPSTPAYVDEIGFVKGNDFFFLYLFSTKNDLADAAVKQARQQYDSAPPQTIPPSRWPENAANSSNQSNTPSVPPVGTAIIAVAGVVVVLIAVLLAVLLIGRRRGTAGRPAGAPSGHQMSADGNYWWDGQAWRNSAESAPPGAQRSADGRYWWDGTKWRESPSSPEPAPATPEPPPPSPSS